MIRVIICGSHPIQRTSCGRWLHIAGLCLCIALSINDHKDDPGTPCLDDPGKHEGKASVKSEFSGIRLFQGGGERVDEARPESETHCHDHFRRIRR